MAETAAGAGTRTQFERQLARVLDPAYGMAFSLTRSREEAEDLVQETAIQAYCGFKSFRDGTNFKAWFFRILINRARNLHRMRQRRPQTTPLDDAPELYLFVQTAKAGLPTAGSDPAGVVLGRMTEEHIRSAIAALPEEFQLASALYFTQEMSYEEIADVLECPIGTVRSRLHRGRKLLQKALWQVAEEHGIVTAAQKAEGKKASRV